MSEPMTDAEVELSKKVLNLQKIVLDQMELIASNARMIHLLTLEVKKLAVIVDAMATGKCPAETHD